MTEAAAIESPVAGSHLSVPRVAYFPDSFHEVNGVAHTSRHFEAFAARQQRPFLCVRAGSRSPALQQQGSVWSLELPRGPLAFAIERDLSFDPAYARHYRVIRETLERFQPDLVHITGPSELGMIGARLAHQLRIPLAASWHTNVHEYLARRSMKALRFLPAPQATAASRRIEQWCLQAATKFYATADVLYAPNPELCEMLAKATGKACHIMPRGVDAHLFHPGKRKRRSEDQEFVLGFVGRLSVEKNVALLATLQQVLDQKQRRFRFRIVGQGSLEGWLRSQLPRAEFPGVLRGEALAEAYANMDLFIFPSHTDTFGNVVLEALASGVPAIVTPDGGPRSIVRDQETGWIANDAEFADAIDTLLQDPARRAKMQIAARSYAETASWDAVFEGVYRNYAPILKVQQP